MRVKAMRPDLYEQFACAGVQDSPSAPATPEQLAFLVGEWITTKARYQEVKSTMLRLLEEGAASNAGGYLLMLDELYAMACIHVDVGRRCNAVPRGSEKLYAFRFMPE
jgi:hypothetical protein